MRIRRDRLDAIFSEFVRTRDQWTCQRCHTFYPPEKRMALHCSHYHGRAKRSTRWDEENCDALCYGCHVYLGSHHDDYRDWKIARLGQERFDLLNMRARTLTKFTKSDRIMLIKLYHDKIRDMKFRELVWAEKFKAEGTC